jgi:hypothetical protein
MKIGLYGDSFVTGSMPKLPDGSYDVGFNYHWSKLLEQELGHDITNLGESGSSIYETYVKFINQHERFEKNIVVLTIPGRYFKKIKLSFDNDNSHIVSIPHLETIKQKNIDELNDDDFAILRDLQGWYNLNDSEYESTVNRLMIKHMYELKPNTIFIKVTDHNLFDEFNIKNKALLDIYYQQCNLLGFDGSNSVVDENQKLISGHFTPEINKLFADYLIKRIETDNWSDWEVPKDLKFQYTKKEYFNL